MDTSRRQVITIAAATITLPMLQAALQTLRPGAAQGASVGGDRGAPAGGRNAPAPAEEPGWFTTKIKAASLKDDEFARVDGHPGILLSRVGKEISAFTSKCTHKGCTIKPKASVKTLTCACHQAQFNLDGTVAKGPAKDPLVHFAIRTNTDGFVEIDPGTKPAADAKEYKATLS